MNTNLTFRVLLVVVTGLCLSWRSSQAAAPTTNRVSAAAVHPIDARLTVAASQFTKASDGAWVTRERKPKFAFDELIYSWHLPLAPEQGFRLYLRVKSEKGDHSPWLYGGYWGKVKQLEKRTEPQFEWGKVAMDQALLQRKAKSFQFKIVDEGAVPLERAPAFSVVVTDNSPPPALVRRYGPRRNRPSAPSVILDLPLRRQADSKGTPIPDRCQSAALATAMEYYGKVVGLEDIVPLTFDVEYDFPGIWPRTLGAGIQHGFEGYIDRFRDWDYVRKTVAENKVILCSIRMPAGEYKAPPYPKIGGHIVALNGVTDDGRVVVTDSALWKEQKGYRCQWLKEDFEKVWLKTKGGVGMVICPPAKAQTKLVKDLPPFPAERLQAAAAPNAASKTPGRIGVYARFTAESASPEKLRETLRFMKSVGIHFIFPSGKGHGVNWDSRIAPKELVKDPGYLDRIIECAHAEGLKVYPVFCVCTEGGEAGPNALLRSNPSWAFFYEGARRGYVDPGNPDARRYEVSLVRELVGQHDVDGLSLDYCRCPNRVGYTDSGRAEFLKKHKVDLAQIVGAGSEVLETEGGKKAASAAAASARAHPIWPEWQKWKTAQINALAREIRAAVNEVKPGLPISSYVWGAHTYTNRSEVCQDWKTWIQEGVLDWINPSGYRYTEESFLEAARLNRKHVPPGFPYYITIGVKTSHGALKDTAEIRKQMQVAQECGADGLLFFTWESLRPFASELAADIKAYGQTK